MLRLTRLAAPSRQLRRGVQLWQRAALSTSPPDAVEPAPLADAPAPTGIAAVGDVPMTDRIADDAPALSEAAAAAPHNLGSHRAMFDAMVGNTASSDATAGEAAGAVGLDALGYWPPELALRVVNLIHEGYDLPWWGAIVGTTLLLRLSLLPLSLQATMMAARLQGLRPHIAAVQAKHAGPNPDTQAMATELQALYKEHGASPLQTVVPALAQAPVFSSWAA
jgi:hypothetical protein